MERNSCALSVFLFLFLFLSFALGASRPVITRDDDLPNQQEDFEKAKCVKQQRQGGNGARQVDGGYYFHDPSYHLQWHLQNLGSVEGEDFIDLAVVPAWAAGYSGKGVVVAVVDSQIDHSLPDLKANIDGSLSKDFNFGAPGKAELQNHAPALAGLIAAVPNNNYCGAGVAFQSSLALLRLLDGSISDETEASALSWQPNDIDIYSCNWGPPDNGNTLKGPGPHTTSTLENAVNTGRNGKGSLYVWAAGNGGTVNDNCNYDGYANSPYTIAVGSVNSYGKYSSFSEPCSAMLTTAPGGEDNTDTFVGITSTDSQDCSSEFTGTDYAAPQVAGVVALMLEANSKLTWRDVQTILVQSSRVNFHGEGAGDWVQNGAGLWHHDHYGFGLLNASKAVFLAKKWKKNSLRTRFCFSSSKVSVQQAIPDDGTTVSTFWKIAEVDFSVEHVRVFFSSTHPSWGDIAINLTSPSGTISKLATKHAQNDKGSAASPQYQEWPFMTVKNWGENPTGNWFLSVSDEVADDYSGTFDKWQLEVCGYYTTSSPVPPPTPPDVFTPDETPVVETDYDQNRSTSQQFAAIFWRFLVVISFLGVIIIAAAFFVSPRSFASWFGAFTKRVGQRDSEGIFDPGDDL